MKLLLIEDETRMVQALKELLEGEHYEVDACMDGISGEEALLSGIYDVVVSDVMLPGKDGFTLLPELKAAGIPVIFLTAKADVQSKVRGLKEGAEDYIVKPFEMLELLVRVEKVLERHQKGREILKVRDVEIDTEKRSVTKAGEEIYLKPMEYDCLLMFVRHKNKALTREQLLKALWGVDFEGETRTVDAHVGRIRKKLGFQDVIRTIPRIGYRLEVDE